MALLAARRRMVAIRVDLDAQIRGLLKTFGLILEPGNTDALIRRAEALVEGNPPIGGLVAKLADVRRHVDAQVAALDRDIRRLVRSEPALRRFMTVPGVGPVVALTYRACVDNPGRFDRSKCVGAHYGLAPRLYQSGETARVGRISRCGDAMLRASLFEAGLVLLTNPRIRWSPLKSWGMAVAERRGMQKAVVALARKLGIILQQGRSLRLRGGLGRTRGTHAGVLLQVDRDDACGVPVQFCQTSGQRSNDHFIRRHAEHGEKLHPRYQ